MRFLKAQEVAQIFNISTARVYELIRLDILPAVRLGRQVRVSEAVLERWIDDGGQALPGGWRWEPPEHPFDQSDDVPW